MPVSEDIERLGPDAVWSAMPVPGTYLPQRVVERLRALSKREDRELLEAIAHAAILVAARSRGELDPWTVLRAAIDGVHFTEGAWRRNIRDEVRKVVGLPSAAEQEQQYYDDQKHEQQVRDEQPAGDGDHDKHEDQKP